MNSDITDTGRTMNPPPMGRWTRVGLCAVLALIALYETWDASMFFFVLDDMWAKPGIAATGAK